MEALNCFDRKEIKKKLDDSLINKVELKLYSQISSTNSEAKNYIMDSNDLESIFKNEKFVFLAADSQYSGRGRRGKNWLSESPASISASFLFKAEGEIEEIPQLTAAAALAVNETLNYFNLDNLIKWPNDILVNGKKICGILSELIFSPNEEAFVVIGCGLNLNNSSFNSSISKQATSYYIEKGEKLNKNIFTAKLIENMYSYIKKYFHGERKRIIKEWKKKLNLKFKKIDLTYKNHNKTAVIKDILDSGELLVDFDNGNEKTLSSLYTSLDYQSLQKYNK